METEMVDTRSPDILMAPDEHQNPELWKSQLRAAGWTQHRPTLWRDPQGGLHLGPFGAWRKMQARAGRPLVS